MSFAPDHQRIARRRPRRVPTGALVLALSLVLAGCGSSGNGNATAGNSGPPLVTGEQVITSCFHAYFYNGILPKSAAETNCQSCVVDQLRKLGVRPASGENVTDMLTGDRLASSDIRSLQSNCDVSDANTQ